MTAHRGGGGENCAKSGLLVAVSGEEGTGKRNQVFR